MLALLLTSVLASGPTPAAGPLISPRAHLDVAPGLLTCIVSELHASGVCLERGPDGPSLRIGHQVHPLPPGDDVLETLGLIFGPGLEFCGTITGTYARNFEFPPLIRAGDPRMLVGVVLPSWRPAAPWEAFAGVEGDGTVGGEPLAVSLDGGPAFVPLRVEAVRPPVTIPAVVGR